MGSASVRQGSSATPLALVYALLIVYASLYPFSSWRWPAGHEFLDLMRLPWPRWRDRFDEVANLLGYLPLGALLYGAVVRSGGRAWAAALLAVLLPAGLSYSMEVTQTFLASRVPSLRDWVLNAAGAAAGMLVAAAAHRLGWVERWQAMRQRWFVRQSAGAIALLLLWPVGLLFPQPVPLGVGQVGDELRQVVLAALADTPWQDAVPAWFMPPTGAADTPLSPLHEGASIALGLLGPCLVAFAVTARGWRRVVLAAGAAGLAFGATTLSTALNFGPDHALSWLTPVSLPALAWGLGLAMLCSLAGRRLAAALGLMALSAMVALVAQAPSDPYFAASLQAWEQGRFIRFHGLARWLGWLWPYLAMLWLLSRLTARHDDPSG
ncbi:VanZ family protein [Aquincola sp. MAHUQ-54]|uniref:VanZ family protein n=1 Tax=Aquincola agrisoli TaxID=3119538 RepID=A0AAW9QJ78_9BURK